MKTKEFMMAKETYLDKLSMFVPIVDRVHGKLHPEFHDVRYFFEIIFSKVKADDYNLSDDFSRLKVITNNYTIPNDVCESYEAVYNMLEKLNQAYDMQGE